MLALFCEKGGKHRILKYEEDICEIEFEWKGQKVVWRWTIEDARRAGLVRPNSGWQKYPKDMLFARCVSSALRKICPELFHGLYTPEEMQSVAEGRVVEAKVVDSRPTPNSTTTTTTPTQEDEDGDYSTLPCDIRLKLNEDGDEVRYEKGFPFAEIPRKHLYRIKSIFESSPLPIRLSKDARQRYVAAIEAAWQQREENRKQEESNNFEEKLKSMEDKELAKLVINGRYGSQKRSLALKELCLRVQEKMKDATREQLEAWKEWFSKLDPGQYEGWVGEIVDSVICELGKLLF